MGRLKVIYATILAAIYVAATLLSSLDVLICDHPHHTHHVSESVECSCHEHHHVATAHAKQSISAECCDHEHELLSDNHTQYIVSNERSNSALGISYLLLTSVAIVADVEGYSSMLSATEVEYRGDESLPLRAAFSRYDSLRAPPSFA